MGIWIDFQEIKALVPIACVLEHYGISGLRRSGPHHYRGRCPLHGGAGQETFHIDGAQQVFHCFSCGAGGSVLDLVAGLEQCGVVEAAQRLADRWGLPAQVRKGRRAYREQTVTKKREVRPLGFRLRGVDGHHPYVSSRGIWPETAQVFGIGYYGGPGCMRGRIVIPIHDEMGRLVAYAGRAVDGSQPRYRFPAGFAKSQVLFNLHRAAGAGRTAVVVEGFFDCLRVYQSGVGSVCALMGSVLYERQRDLLEEHFRRVVLMLDGDAAGRQASARILGQFHGHLPVSVIQLPADRQPDEYPEEIIRTWLGRGGVS
jgi:DNA primase